MKRKAKNQREPSLRYTRIGPVVVVRSMRLPLTVWRRLRDSAIESRRTIPDQAAVVIEQALPEPMPLPAEPPQEKTQ